jgi:2-aminoadipate transaminase
MENLFASRTRSVHRSFIREILKVTADPAIISFAGGLPNPAYFPVVEVAEAAAKVLAESGAEVLQYSTTEGYLPLREWIAARYLKRFGMKVDPAEVLITSGSQQGLDLIGKVFLNRGDRVLLERPAYLGAIQAFGMFEPTFRMVPLEEDGPNLEYLETELWNSSCKLFYTVPNFQNPSGVSYSAGKRRAVARLLAERNTILVEDDPYGELRFIGEDQPPIHTLLPGRSILLGSFSKIVAPGLRLGWIYAPAKMMERLITMKQGTDLHSNYLAQQIIHRHLTDHDLDDHVARIRSAYKAQRDLMVELLEELCPPEVSFTRPEGGMFLWMTLPEGISALELFEVALRENVAFVPGAAFYTDGGGGNTLRLNFSNSNPVKIEAGTKRLCKAIERLMNEKAKLRRAGA